MKRFVAFLVAFVLTISALPLAIGAEKYDGESLVVQFEDGSYITEEITLTQFRVRNAVSGSRVRNFYNSSGNLCWKITLYGVFRMTAQAQPVLHRAVMSPCTPLIGM